MRLTVTTSCSVQESTGQLFLLLSVAGFSITRLDLFEGVTATSEPLLDDSTVAVQMNGRGFSFHNAMNSIIAACKSSTPARRRARPPHHGVGDVTILKTEQ